MKRLFILLALLGATAFAQDQRQMEVNVGGPGPGPRREAPAPKKMTPEQLKRGQEWMQAAEAEAKGLEGGMRAYALLQVARSLGPEQKAHAVELLEDALNASRAMDDDAQHMRTQLQRDIVQAIVPLAPRRADELLMQLDPAGRQSVLKALLDYYRQKKLENHAIEMVYRISAEDEFPYEVGLDIMRGLPANRRGDVQQMFTTALESYRNHKHPGIRIGGGDFAQLIIELQPKLSPDVVKDAIAEVLKQAETPSDEGPQTISIASERGTAAMSSYYDFRLFQLLPTLRAVDPDEAERLLKKNREVAGMLDKYPQGSEQLLGQQNGHGGGMVSVSSGNGGPGGGRGPMAGADAQRAMKIVADAAEHPDEALANVSTLTSPMSRLQALDGIAHQAWKKNPGVAKSALKQLMDVLPQLPHPEMRVLPAVAAAELYVKMGEPDEARKVIEKGLETAADLYKQDTDADDPNTALEAYWPSTAAYRRLLQVAAEISPDWALQELKAAPDDQIAAVARIGMASALMGKPRGETTMLTEKKDGHSSMMMTTDQ